MGAESLKEWIDKKDKKEGPTTPRYTKKDETPTPMRITRGSTLKSKQIKTREQQKEESDKKRRKDQDNQAVKNKKQRVASLPVVKRGDIVILKVDVRDQARHTNAGLICVVLEIGKGGGVRVACQHGIICNGLQRKKLFVSCDSYSVPKGRPTLTSELLAVQQMIQCGVLEEELGLKKTTIKAAHRAEFGGNVEGRGKCGCKNGKCRRGTCGCAKNGRPCSSACSCHANCQLTADS
jgi:hypothetical protein